MKLNTDKLNTDFMDMMEIALNNTQRLSDHKEIVFLSRRFKDHLEEIEAALSEKDVIRHG
ncbi:hypothetical protein [Sporolactobacillus terrae]|uniref:Uncharacterized protein n=1 Tax=Sporolactobacillus terrae TaxID=269673 RepID=A0A5K7X2M2_9BACL|nr:hypothetical protein [Sporolactobacillus terrae]BBN99188.1 hypothetical protein St703_18930 [Sporolactobacillus terrae]